MSTDARPRAVIGIGDERRRDGSVGRVVARALTGERLPEDVEILEGRTPDMSVLAEMQRFSFVVLVVGIDTENEPGTVTVLSPEQLDDWLAPAVSAEHSVVTIADCLGIGAMAFELPEVWCIAVQPKEIVPGTGLSVEVGSAVADVVAKVKELLGIR